MDVSGLIASFATGLYQVTRTARGGTFRGRTSPGATTTFDIVAAVVPAIGGDLVRLPEGRRTNETRAIYTTSELFIGGQVGVDGGGANEADRVLIDDQDWEVQHVEVWDDPTSGEIGYKCLAQAAR